MITCPIFDSVFRPPPTSVYPLPTLTEEEFTLPDTLFVKILLGGSATLDRGLSPIAYACSSVLLSSFLQDLHLAVQPVVPSGQEAVRRLPTPEYWANAPPPVNRYPSGSFAVASRAPPVPLVPTTWTTSHKSFGS